MRQRQSVTILVQARMASRRLPGKSLRPIRGRPMLQYVLERLQHCRESGDLAVCTSTSAEDDAIATLCQSLGVACFRGSHLNVAERFMQALDHFGARAFVRICGDSPLIDPAIVDEAMARLLEGEDEIVTNNLLRTFPAGQTVEAFRSQTYRRGFARMQHSDELEHVTRHFYRYADRFRILNFTNETDLSNLRLSVDGEEDLARVEGILGQMTRPHWDYGLREIVDRFCTMPV